MDVIEKFEVDVYELDKPKEGGGESLCHILLTL